MENIKLFAEFLKEQVLDQNNYQRILEILNPPAESLAMYLNKPTYLLNNLVTEEALSELGLIGENGTLTEEGIILPKRRVLTYKIQGKDLPNINEFDLILGAGISTTSFAASKFPQDKAFGFCTEATDPTLNLRLTRANSLMESYNASPNNGYELLTTEEKGKVYCLVRKTK